MKKIIRIKSISPYNIGEFEGWLNYMSEKGWQLNLITRNFYHFIKSNSRYYYKIDIFENKLTEEYKDICNNNNWQYVCSNKNVHVIRSTGKEEFHTDIKEQYNCINKVYKKASNLMNIFLILMIIIASLSINLLTKIDRPLLFGYYMITELSINAILTLFIIIRISEFKYSIRNTLNTLKSGQHIKSNNGWKKRKILNLLIYIPCLICIIIIIISIYDSINVKTENISDSTVVNSVRLNEIEGYEDPIYYSDDSGIETNYIKQYKTSFYNYYEAEEEIYDENIKFNGETYIPVIEIKIYNIKFNVFTDEIYKEVIADYESFIGCGLEETQVYKNSKFNKIYVWTNAAGIKLIIAQNNNKVISVYYYGKHTLDEILDYINEYNW